MNELVVATICCPQCGTVIAPGSDRCSQCGVPAAASRDLPVSRHPLAMIEVTTPATAWLDNRWIVTGLLLTVGPVGLLALWLSRRFSRCTKIITTVLFFLATVVLPLAAAWYFCDFALRPLVDAMAGANQAR